MRLLRPTSHSDSSNRRLKRFSGLNISDDQTHNTMGQGNGEQERNDDGVWDRKIQDNRTEQWRAGKHTKENEKNEKTR